MRQRFVHRPEHPNANERGMVNVNDLGGEQVVTGGIHVISDIEPFKSPIDGTVISSRSHIREHEKAHGVRQIGNDWCGRERPAWWDRRKAIAYGKEKP